MTLTEARAMLLKTVLHVGNETFSPERLDYALQTSLDQFARATKCATTTTGVPLALGVSEFDPSTALDADFTEDDLLDRCSISGYRVGLAPYGTVLRRHEGGSPASGRPKMLAVESDTRVILDASCDQAYTLKVVHAAGLTDWVAGTADPDGVSINVPEDWARLVIATGCKRTLLDGVAFAHNDVPQDEEFWRVVERGRLYFQHDKTGAGVKPPAANEGT